MLGRVPGHIGVHSLLLRVAEQEEGTDQGSARVCEVGESRVSLPTIINCPYTDRSSGGST